LSAANIFKVQAKVPGVAVGHIAPRPIAGFRDGTPTGEGREEEITRHHFAGRSI